MKRILTIVFSLLILCATNGAFAKKKKSKAEEKAFQNDLPAYMIYDKEGKKVTYSAMIKELKKHEILLFGELHDDPIAHWLEKLVTKEIVAAKKDSVILGGEMWETDQQLLLNELLNRTIDKKTYMQYDINWPNFRDYKPLIGIAMKNDLPFICTNIPRRYANIIYKQGEEYLDSLSAQAKSYLPPMPVYYDLTQPAYANMLSLFASDDDKGHKSHNPMAKFKGPNLVKAQAIKDATMAHNILKHWKKGKYFIHYNGVYHSQNYQSIYFYLKHYKPEVDIVTISVARQANALELEGRNKTGDFNIIVNGSMHKTYD
ncbi:MAG: ChaN family lipoprotein [Labilibaculum sp.]|nr:ChaN family lipoprotein [Labilibaculum sp.]MBI9059896.1 ChaN family lipoprotein [Labilibaculum sp.]